MAHHHIHSPVIVRPPIVFYPSVAHPATSTSHASPSVYGTPRSCALSGYSVSGFPAYGPYQACSSIPYWSPHYQNSYSYSPALASSYGVPPPSAAAPGISRARSAIGQALSARSMLYEDGCESDSDLEEGQQTGKWMASERPPRRRPRQAKSTPALQERDLRPSDSQSQMGWRRPGAVVLTLPVVVHDEDGSHHEIAEVDGFRGAAGRVRIATHESNARTRAASYSSRRAASRAAFSPLPSPFSVPPLPQLLQVPLAQPHFQQLPTPARYNTSSPRERGYAPQPGTPDVQRDPFAANMTGSAFYSTPVIKPVSYRPSFLGSLSGLFSKNKSK